MKENKTKKHGGSVSEFLAKVPNEERREDAKVVMKMMEEVTGEKPAMWGPSIVGFGSYHYIYASGHSGDAAMQGFSPRKEALVLYVMPGYQDYSDFLKKLGPHKMGKACLYIKHLRDIDLVVLRKLLERGYADMLKIKKEKGW